MTRDCVRAAISSQLPALALVRQCLTTDPAVASPVSHCCPGCLLLQRFPDLSYCSDWMTPDC